MKRVLSPSNSRSLAIRLSWRWLCLNRREAREHGEVRESDHECTRCLEELSGDVIGISISHVLMN